MPQAPLNDFCASSPDGHLTFKMTNSFFENYSACEDPDKKKKIAAMLLAIRNDVSARYSRIRVLFGPGTFFIYLDKIYGLGLRYGKLYALNEKFYSRQDRTRYKIDFELTESRGSYVVREFLRISQKPNYF